MPDRRAVLLIVCALFLLCSAGSANSDPAQREGARPSLPLPDPSPDEIAVPNWSADRQLPNSTRAWHYNPDLVRPLLEVADAVDNTILDFRMRRMLIAVVASRNYCLY